MLEERNMTLEISEKTRELIAEEGYDPDFGARPLRRSIQKLIENSLSEEILQGKFQEGDTIMIDVKDGQITFSKKERKTKIRAKIKS